MPEIYFSMSAAIVKSTDKIPIATHIRLRHLIEVRGDCGGVSPFFNTPRFRHGWAHHGIDDYRSVFTLVIPKSPVATRSVVLSRNLLSVLFRSAALEIQVQSRS